MNHEELLKLAGGERQTTVTLVPRERLTAALAALVELPREFTDEMNVRISDGMDPVVIAKMFYRAGYKDAISKVRETIEKELK